jgi:hypothetical protein
VKCGGCGVWGAVWEDTALRRKFWGYKYKDKACLCIRHAVRTWTEIIDYFLKMLMIKSEDLSIQRLSPIDHELYQENV